MNYLYMNCKDIGRDQIKKRIVEKYGVHIGEKSLYEETSVDNKQRLFLDKLDKAKRTVKTAPNTKSAYERLIKKIKGENTEQVRLKTVVREIENIIYNFYNYEDDLAADILMGLLWADKNNNLGFNQKIQVKEGKKGSLKDSELIYLWKKSMNLKDAQKNYVYANIRNYPNESVPGGCLEYHKVMMQPDHIITFDMPDTVETGTNIGKYTYPKMDTIYQELIGAPIENILLLERTVGIGFTNILFLKLHDVKETEELNQYSEFMKRCMDIEPIFIRKRIVNVICDYMITVSGKTDDWLLVVTDLVDIVIYILKQLYEPLFEYTWSLYYMAYWNSEEDKKYILEILREETGRCWETYYEDWQIYHEFLKEYKMFNWRAEKTVEDFFEKIDADEIGRLTLLEKVVPVNIKCANGEMVSFWARKPLEGLGEKIRDKALKECGYELSESLSEEDARKLLYKKEEEFFAHLWKAEKDSFNNAAYSYNKIKITKIILYAYIQIQVIQKNLLGR